MPPTEKQVAFANVIAKKLNVKLPEYTRTAYNQFIGYYLPHFRKADGEERKKVDALLREASVGYWEYF